MSSPNTPFSSSSLGDLAAQRMRLPAAKRGQPQAFGGEAALGTITKYEASGMGAGSRAINSVVKTQKIEVIDPETGEITQFERSKSGEFVQAKRLFEDGRQARYNLHRAFKQIEPKHRTASCLWSVVSAEKSVQVWHPRYSRLPSIMKISKFQRSGIYGEAM